MCFTRNAGVISESLRPRAFVLRLLLLSAGPYGLGTGHSTRILISPLTLNILLVRRLWFVDVELYVLAHIHYGAGPHRSRFFGVCTEVMGPVVIWRQRSGYGLCLNRGAPILPFANLGAYERSVRVPARVLFFSDRIYGIYTEDIEDKGSPLAGGEFLDCFGNTKTQKHSVFALKTTKARLM